ncbi:hypothetical protein BV25DRAFT_1825347 [Artomyces pyxidatus]|uniref:Uncharacterized protein n=1 Tax=Artomyces pyxidatus TaxID=48021 RepID=A0ACB8T3S7_9AGAM|nr:hypothetical protein BV25DRAFT_1825347 [Artomyces pyxidatus]
MLHIPVTTNRESAAKFALDVVLTPQADKIQAVHDFVKSGPSFVDTEPDTLHWFGFKTADKPDGTPGVFGVFDTFPHEAGRGAHVGGALATALFANAETLLSGPPQIAPVVLLGHKATAGVGPTVGVRMTFSAKAETAEQVRALANEREAEVRNEPNVPYWYKFQKDATAFGIVALFRSEEERSSHMGSPATLRIRAKVEGWLDGPVDVSLFDVIAWKTS